MSRWMPAVLSLALLALGAAAEETEAAKPSGPQIPLRVEIVFNRFQGEQKATAAPYVLAVRSGEQATAVKIGLQVPVLVKLPDATTVMFKDAATRIECAATALPDGRFRLAFELDQTRPTDTQTPSAPVLHTFSSRVTVVLRDGETRQIFAVTDPVGGESLKLDAGVSVVR